MPIDPRKDISRGIEAVATQTTDSVNLEDINDFVYVKKAVPGPASSDYDFDSSLSGCDCQGSCTVDANTRIKTGCCCLHEKACVYNAEGHIVGVDPYKSSMKPIYECNRFCKCPENCINRVVQKGITINLEVFNARRKGLGLRALTGIAKGQFVCEYAGEIISRKVAKFRADSQTPDDKNYIMALREHVEKGKVISTYVDPKSIGNAGRFINHSCEPNLFMIPVRIDNNIPRLALFALRNIQKGEELSFDYSGEIQSNRKQCKKVSETDEDIETIKLDNLIKNQKQITNRLKICLCSSKLCRGYLPMDESLYQ